MVLPGCLQGEREEERQAGLVESLDGGWMTQFRVLRGVGEAGRALTDADALYGWRGGEKECVGRLRGREMQHNQLF